MWQRHRDVGNGPWPAAAEAVGWGRPPLRPGTPSAMAERLQSLVRLSDTAFSATMIEDADMSSAEISGRSDQPRLG